MFVSETYSLLAVTGDTGDRKTETIASSEGYAVDVYLTTEATASSDHNASWTSETTPAQCTVKIPLDLVREGSERAH